MSESERRYFNLGLQRAIGVIQAGIHSAASQAGLWGVQDDDAYFIAAINKLTIPSPKGDTHEQG